MTKLIRTVLYDEYEEVIGMAETEVENVTDIERHLEHWHNLKTAFKKNEIAEEEKLSKEEEIELD